MLKVLGWMGFIGQTNRLNKKESRVFQGSISSLLSYFLITCMLGLIVAGFALLSFLFLLDLNELRKNNIENSSIAGFFEDNNIIIERVDTSVKPYLKRFLKVVHHHANLPYEFDRDQFESMNTLEVINNFSKVANITNAGDLFSLIKDCIIDKVEENTNVTIPVEKNYFKIGNNIYNIIGDFFRDRTTHEINTHKILDTF